MFGCFTDASYVIRNKLNIIGRLLIFYDTNNSMLGLSKMYTNTQGLMKKMASRSDSDCFSLLPFTKNYGSVTVRPNNIQGSLFIMASRSVIEAKTQYRSSVPFKR